MARVLEDREVEPCPLGMLQLFGEFYRTPGGHPENKGFENPFPNQPNPLQKERKPTQQSRGTIRERICALEQSKKYEKEMVLGGFGVVRKKEMGVMGVRGWAAVMMVDGWVT
jgi:hypothetical protein